MTREETKNPLPIIQAFAEGKMIQDKIEGLTDWCDTDEINLEYNGIKIKHRIKPEQTYRPFKSQEECVKEMMNHKPFGIVTDGIRDFEVAIYPDGIFILGTYSNLFYKQSFYIALKEYKFPDSTPFGIKEE